MALIHYHGKNILGVCLPSGEIVRLLPGVNEIEDDRMAQVKTHPQFQSRVKKGLAQILVDNVGKDGKRSVEDMLSLIPGMYDTRLLKKIIDSDGRDKVVRAAAEQLDKIKNPTKAKEDSENEHFT
jgi:hypothetical protein